MQPIYLNSSCLFSKWGFADGDILDDWMYEKFQFQAPDSGPWDDNLGLEHCILHRLIMDHLIPLCPSGFSVHTIGSCHNPVRADQDQLDPCVCATVTYEQFCTAADQVIQGI